MYTRVNGSLLCSFEYQHLTINKILHLHNLPMGAEMESRGKKLQKEKKRKCTFAIMLKHFLFTLEIVEEENWNKEGRRYSVRHQAFPSCNSSPQKPHGLEKEGGYSGLTVFFPHWWYAHTRACYFVNSEGGVTLLTSFVFCGVSSAVLLHSGEC